LKKPLKFKFEKAVKILTEIFEPYPKEQNQASNVNRHLIPANSLLLPANFLILQMKL